MMKKRVTITVELLSEITGDSVWAHMETAKLSSGDNPRFHHEDFAQAIELAGGHCIDVAKARFGEVE